METSIVQRQHLLHFQPKSQLSHPNMIQIQLLHGFSTRPNAYCHVRNDFVPRSHLGETSEENFLHHLHGNLERNLQGLVDAYGVSCTALVV